MAFSNGWRYGAPGVPTKYGSNREVLDVDAIEALRRSLEKESPVEAELQGTVVAV